MKGTERGEKNPDGGERHEEELLTVDEVAALLKINPQTVRNRIDAGELPAVRLGRRVRVQRSVLEDLIGWQHGELDPEALTDSGAELPFDVEAGAASLEQIGTGFIKLAAALRFERGRAYRKSER